MGPCPLLLKKNLNLQKSQLSKKLIKVDGSLSPNECFSLQLSVLGSMTPKSECVCVLSCLCACLAVSAIMCVCACLDVSAPVQERERSVGERKEERGKEGEKDANVLK